MSRNVFVLGIDDFNLDQLKSIRNASEYNFESLLTFDEVKEHGTYPFRKVLDQARQRLRDYGDEIHALVGYWDFPVTSVVPILCREFDLPGPSVEAVARCEHKYWSRVEQRKAVPDLIPAFEAVNPFDEQAADKLGLEFPFWLKPVKGTDSLLGFKIESREDFEQALQQVREHIGPIAGAFNDFLSHAELPEEIRGVDGHHCIAEHFVKGEQCTVSGYAHNGKVYTYGVVDSINYPDSSSFFRYEYPSTLDESVQRRLRDASVKVMTAIGYDNAAFNIEFFYDREQDRISILEINPRISQSHGHLYEQVDGSPNHQIMVELALGRAPDFPHGEGPYGCAAEFHMRRFEDAVVRKAPEPREVRAVEREVPGTIIDVQVKQGMRLSEMIEQDSYSYDVAHIYMAARDQRELLGKYDQVVEKLPFEFSS